MWPSRTQMQGKPDLHMTLTGILTKPDLVDKGTEGTILNVAKNLTYRLKKGFMMVRCRGQQEIMNKLSLAEATKNETEFFQTHPYFRSVPHNLKVGHIYTWT